MHIIDYLTSHWGDIITALTSIIIAARVIVKLTPTPKDDSALESIVDFLKHLGLVIKDKTPVILGLFCILTLPSCDTTSTGEKTFFGITGKQGLTIFSGVVKREALPVFSEVQSARAATSAKNYIKILP